ncbi:Probable inactive ATP-dependent zinc metalloprotease FTSHI 1, chloroplastic [Dionaea muscipula]
MHASHCSMFIRVYPPIPIPSSHNPSTFTVPISIRSKQFRFSKHIRHKHNVLTFQSLPILCKSSSGSSNRGTAANEEDFVARVLRENPSQVEPKVRIGDKVLTMREAENLNNQGLNFDFGALEILRRLDLKAKRSNEVSEGSSLEGGNGVHLKDILRKYRGKLYVPEQMFGAILSEAEEFDENLETLPKMSYEELASFLKNEKVKLLTAKEGSRVVSGKGVRDFIVELKETPGAIGPTKWAACLDADLAQTVLEEYNGPLYEIETRSTTQIIKLPDYPNPVASSISSRMMIELGMVTAAMAAAALIVGGYLASAVFAVTSLIFVSAVLVVWPVAKSFFSIFLGVILSIVDIVWDNLLDIFSGVSARIFAFSVAADVSTNLQILSAVMVVFMIMTVLLRFTLSRRSRNIRHWDIWQGIEFSLSKAEARVDGSTGVTFADVAGIEEAVEELQELVKYLKNPELFDKLGIKPPHGVLLAGPPGCGKTLVAKAIAGEAGVPFYQMAGSEFVELLVGVGSARIRDLFKRAKVNKPSVVFIDEIDALATRRQGIFSESTKEIYNAGTQERETTLNQLLTELDGFDTGKGVIFLGATNRMDLLDPALLRPGRFDRKIKVQPPDAKGRLEILKVHARKVNLSPSVDLSAYADSLPGWTGAKLAQLMQEAALVAARKEHESIGHSDIDEAVDRLTIGPKRVGMQLSHQGQCRRAATEVGTAITSHLLRRLEGARVEPCDRVSIYPRGQTLSQVVFRRLDEELYRFEKLPQLLHRLQVFLGGRAAEEVIYGRDTSTASLDYLADASWFAQKIITIWNLQNPLTIHGEPPQWMKEFKFVGPRLDFEGSLYDHYNLIQPALNSNMEDLVAERTEELLRDLYQKTVALLRSHHAALLKTVKVLLNQKEIRGVEIDHILDSYPPQTPVSLLLEEENPDSLPFFREAEEHKLEYALSNVSRNLELRSM